MRNCELGELCKMVAVARSNCQTPYKSLGNNMKKLVQELKKQIVFKDTIKPGDVAIIAAEEPKMLFFVIITGIMRDDSRKDEWWQVSMQSLTVPLQLMTWTLRMPQMCGQEIFTMSGEERFMAAVRIDFQENEELQGAGVVKKRKKKGGDRVGLRLIK